MASGIVTIEISVAWWFSWYVAILLLVAALMCAEPDPEKLARVLHRAVRVRARRLA